jgi:hypothetical protein
MVDYMPLTSDSPNERDDDDELEPLKGGGKVSHESNSFNVENRPAIVWLTILMAVAAILAAVTLHISILSTSRLEPLRSPNDVIFTLETVKPDTNLQKGRAIMRQMDMNRPELKFPMSMVRANAAEPNKVYYSGASVFLSPSDSMFYHWKTNTSWPRCYISSWVSASKQLVAGNKSYIAEGDVTAIEIWNITPPTDPTMMSWNTRPKRLSLMGTVNFTSREIQNQTPDLDGQELRSPTPLLNCRDEVDLTVEIACKSCRLQFDQIYTDPPLGFELVELA